MKVNTYKVISDAVENGIKYGWYRAHKHTDEPAEDEIKNRIQMAIMAEMIEYFFIFDQEGDQ